MAFVAISTDPADARSRRKKSVKSTASAEIHKTRSKVKRVRVVRAGGYNPPYAAIVVDANSGATLHEESPDATRHPASLTKIMTLYLLFERLESGRVKLDAPLEVSSHAASQAPSKLGLRPGQTISVENAIKAVVTKSANDIAVVIAEAVGGSEDEFARMMTRKARALGMSRTTYVNASGLPDTAQITTARDQALLGRAIQDRFPKYFGYFATHSFAYGGKSMRNHNRLLGNVHGVDGIKTGYTRASGFNLVTSVHRDGRNLVAVVLGGRSGASRDARMRDLIGDTITEASVRRTAPMLAEAPTERPAPVASSTAAPAAEKPAPLVVAQAGPAAPLQIAPIPTPRAEIGTTTAGIAQPRLGSTDPLLPILVKTLSLRPPASTTASGAGIQVASAEPMAVPPAPAKSKPVSVMSASASPSDTPSRASETSSSAKNRSGWQIQVGAFPEESEAKQRLSSVKSTAPKLLSSADPFTETVSKGSKTLYRARFAGLDKETAEAACKYLKRNDVACLTIKN